MAKAKNDRKAHLLGMLSVQAEGGGKEGGGPVPSVTAVAPTAVASRRRRHPITLSIDAMMHDRLAQASQKTMVPMSRIVERGLDAELDRIEKRG